MTTAASWGCAATIIAAAFLWLVMILDHDRSQR